ncbi:1-phosphofructokinase [Clostridium sp. D2Q-11]|uniref:Tagatose-6-phosphate kinase n=1 Tax=Anaeromonas frigoriresistens TaxID=2683708 RepID=A0A942Z7C9_9FIRM|nr:1-phosphofructokinase [Anaeromonas frigoriresistens]MBS4538552.1 1-phosphofructokinase [Anaeromonas frigoriresistens]
MIYTVTFNPAIDYVLEVEDFNLGNVNRSKDSYKYPGGKGINISRVLNILETDNQALGFIGGFTGEYINNYLRELGIQTDFISVEGDTRINVKLKSGKETEINAPGPNISERDLEALFNQIDQLKSKDFLVLAGNVQKTLPRDIYSRIQARCMDKDIKVVVDTTGEALISTIKNKPFLIKPNHHELSQIFDVEIEDREQAIIYSKKLLELGAQNIIVSMGGEGAVLVSQEGIYYGEAPKGIVRNSVGAGDSLIAGFLAKYSQSKDTIESFRWGIAAGSATAFSMDLCSKEEVENLVKSINIKKIN